jgi:hypothetical protein
MSGPLGVSFRLGVSFGAGFEVPISTSVEVVWELPDRSLITALESYLVMRDVRRWLYAAL